LAKDVKEEDSEISSSPRAVSREKENLPAPEWTLTVMAGQMREQQSQYGSELTVKGKSQGLRIQ
jgi:hypothetical protein